MEKTKPLNGTSYRVQFLLLHTIGYFVLVLIAQYYNCLVQINGVPRVIGLQQCNLIAYLVRDTRVGSVFK